MSGLVLASSSKYRRALLTSAGYEFEHQSPNIDETALDNEPAELLVRRLAQKKAEAVAADYPDDAYVLGLDQVLSQHERIFGKPADEEEAFNSLMGFKGKSATLVCAVALCHRGHARVETSEVVLQFGHFSEQQVRNYIAMEQPFDCAGGLKTETRGGHLLQSIHSSDPTAIIGLPVLTINRMLTQAQFPHMPLG